MSTPTRRTTSRSILVSIGIAVTGLIASPVASAATNPSPTPHTGIDGARARCLEALDKRLDTVERFMVRTDGATGAPQEDRTELASQLEGVRASLTASKPQIESATEAKALREACKNMVTSTRVYRLYGVKTHALVVSGRVTTLSNRMPALTKRFETALERAERRGVSDEQIADAKAAWADAEARFEAAQSRTDGLLNSLMDITPAQVNDDSATETLSTSRETLKLVLQDATAMRADLKEVRSNLGRTS